MVMPADHVIEPEQEFRRAAHAAEQFAIGLPGHAADFRHPANIPLDGLRLHPSRRACGDAPANHSVARCGVQGEAGTGVAEQFVASGDYFWNSGIFVWKPAAILGELESRKPELHAAIARIAAAWGTPRGQSVFPTEYEKAEKISIDFAVMQDAAKAGKVLVMHAPYQWDDVGSWLALERHNPQDRDGNTVQALHAGVATKNCVIVSDAGHLIGTLGVSDLIIIQNGNATLITTRQAEAGREETGGQDQGRWAGTVPVSRDAKSAKGVLLGFDYGTIRVGVAVTDPDRIIASRLATYTRHSDALDAAYYTRIATECRAVALVVGLPLHANGDESEKSREARTFGAWLSSVTGLTVVFWDERFTTALADDVLDATRTTKSKRKGRRDQLAAQLMLQSYLDANCPPEGTEPLPSI